MNFEPSAQSPEHYLRRCIELAKLGESNAFPNPIVGCVIVHDGEIIGEGFHEYFGGPHAEVNAINNAIAVIARSRATSQSSSIKDWITTIYISLEPCSHHGKTPPCTDLIIEYKFKTLVYACSDPNPLVAGKGIAKIKAAGIEVIGPQELDPEIVREAEFINRAFFSVIKARSTEPSALSPQPWLSLKIAITKDGRMITNNNEPRWITNTNARKDVHRLRSTHQLIVTSYQTVIADDPLYTVRYSLEELKLAGIKQPDIAILKSTNNFTDEDRSGLQIFQTQDQRKVFEYKANDLKIFIADMVKNSYQKIMIEAGPKLSKAFIDADLVDELIVYSPSDNFQENLKKIFGRDFELVKIEEIKAEPGEENNFKAIFSLKKWT